MESESGAFFEVQHRQVPGAVLLSVAGTLDAASAERMRGVLLAAIDAVSPGAPPRTRTEVAGERTGGPIIVDLTRVDFIDSEGVGALVGGFKHAIDRGVRLRFVVVHPLVQRVFQIVGLMHVFDVYPSLAEALASPSAPDREPAEPPRQKEEKG